MIYSDDWLTIYGGDCRTVLTELPDESVHCVVTSPPYWGLRDYGVADQLGLEPTPEQYVENMVAVFREVRRVLRSDGTVWLNLGDSYAGTGAMGTAGGHGPNAGVYRAKDGGKDSQHRLGTISGLKPKDLVGIPWRVAFALQADGWYLRSDIIWSKPNPMPESVTDRPTKSHEYVFLLSKSARYFFDADAVREAHAPGSVEHQRYYTPLESGQKLTAVADDRERVAYSRAGNHPAGRNIRSVWTVATAPYPGAHFAVFPEKLVEPCILAGTSERGVCPECGKPWRRVTETERIAPASPSGWREAAKRWDEGGRGSGDLNRTVSRTLSWIPSCAHDADPVGAVVLDPFGGSGTTARVANRLSRRAILIDLNPEYLKQQMDRNRDIPLGLGAA